MSDHSSGRKTARFFWFALLSVNAVSIFGYATFGLNPGLLARFPWSAAVFAVSYPLFAQLQIVASLLALFALLIEHVGSRWVVAFFVVCLISGTSEFLGTGYGIPFGKYEYTALLGAKFAGRVPFLIPPSWFSMSVPAFALADYAGRNRDSSLFRVGLGSLLLLMWDLTLDPAMSHLIPFWIWEKSGPFYGMPWSNLFGWYVTGVMIMLAFEGLRVSRWMRLVPIRKHVLYYAANLMLPLGMCVTGGLWMALAFTALVGLGAAVLGYFRFPWPSRAVCR